MNQERATRRLWLASGALLLVAVIVGSAWFLKGVGDADCFFNNPNAATKQSCGAELQANLWKKNLSLTLLCGSVVLSLVAYTHKS